MVGRTSWRAVALTALLSAASRSLAASPVYIGCFSSSDGLSDHIGQYTYQSSGYCQEKCLGDSNQAVLGLTGGDDCYCGGQVPPASDKVDDSRCSTVCTGYGQDNCGGNGYWSIYTTGNGDEVTSTDGSSVSGASSGPQQNSGKASSGSSPTGTRAPSVVTSISPGKTVVVTQSSTAEASQQKGASNGGSSDGGGSSSHTGVIVGVVIGVIALIALGVGLWFFLARKRKQQDAESHTVPASAGGMAETPKEWKIPSVARHTQYGRPGGADSRLTDNVAGNRASSYSLDDSNDYTRKILTVANPDRS